MIKTTTDKLTHFPTFLLSLILIKVYLWEKSDIDIQIFSDRTKI